LALPSSGGARHRDLDRHGAIGFGAQSIHSGAPRSWMHTQTHPDPSEATENGDARYRLDHP
jgi:hypothetical protein